MADPSPPESSLSKDHNRDGPSPEDLEERLSAWMRAAQGGDTAAYRNLLVTIQPRIRAIVLGKIREEAAAEDVVQNTLLSIHRGRSTYRPERPFGPWMRAIVRNSIVDHFRDRKRRGDREVEFVAEDWPDESPTAEAGGDRLAPELGAALAALPESQREAVRLIQMEGLSVAEAALRVGISPGALKVRAHRGYRAMRQALEGAREGGEWRSARPSRSTKESTSRGTG
jgi:RNA polymerase sigma factor (sigma-70 family)